MFKKCEFCGKLFEVDEKNKDERRRKYCSDLCNRDMQNERSRERARNGKSVYNTECEVCGKIFITPYPHKVTCSPECQRDRHKKILRENNRIRREAIANGTLPKPERKKRKKVETIEEIQRKARELGMTYRKYVEMIQIQQMREERAKHGRAKNVCKNNNR